MGKVFRFILFISIFTVVSLGNLLAQEAMINITARKITSLNGSWNAILDPADVGNWRQIWLDKKPEKKTDFIEYSFEGGPLLKVPGDFNTQMPELTYEECTVWYRKIFDYQPDSNKRLFLHFGAVNYLADVYLNGKKLGSHEGGFTPFQFELTGVVKPGKNSLILRVNNQRVKDGLPGLGYDWFNYGGITRDVNLIETANTFIEDYFIQLKKNSPDKITGWIKLNGNNRDNRNVRVRIPDLKLDRLFKTGKDGIAVINFSSNIQLWSPQNPKLYRVIVEAETDTVTDLIGFRNIEVQGTRIMLNGKPIFIKAVNIHEEKPLKPGRANSEEDARILLGWAKELGCNLVRLAHYPHNENMVRMAEKMGLMVWDEIPVYQNIQFSSAEVNQKMKGMMTEMIRRDKNRCGVIIWSLSNETNSSPDRDHSLIELSKQCRMLDSTRLITSVINDQHYKNDSIHVWDTLYKYFDVMSINEYLGWYVPWQSKPDETRWELVYQKPIFISEFGGEAKFGNNDGPKDEAASWSEEYQEQIYKDQVALFNVTPNLAGVCAWILVDYRSPTRLHPIYQQGYNRKGLLSELGEKKKAWYILNQYYKTKD